MYFQRTSLSRKSLLWYDEKEFDFYEKEVCFHIWIQERRRIYGCSSSK